MNNKILRPKKRKKRSDKGKKRKKYIQIKSKPKKSSDNKVTYICDICQHDGKNKTGKIIHYLNYHATLEERINQYNYYCKTCNFGVMSEGLYKTHLQTKKHKYLTILNTNQKK